MKKMPEILFCTRISNCGTTWGNSSYSTFKSKDALELLIYTSTIISKETVGSELALSLLFDLAKLTIQKIDLPREEIIKKLFEPISEDWKIKEKKVE